MAKAKKGFLDGYRTYNPAEEGYGSEDDWFKAFNERMGVDEATQAMGNDNPLTIMGFKVLPTMEELKTAYRKLIRIHHPDFGGSHQSATRLIAAYSLLEDRIRRNGR